LVKKFNGLDLNTFRVKEWKGELIFLYEIIEGLAESSYGIQVGKMAGLPNEVTELASSILSKLEQKDNDFLDTSNQLSLNLKNEKSHKTDYLEALSNEIDSIDIDRTSPIQALEKLYEIKNKLNENKYKK